MQHLTMDHHARALAASLEGKARGQSHALSAAHEYRNRFRLAVVLLCMNRERFTSEDVVERVGLPTGEVGINHNNAVGAMMTGLARQGIIRKTGERRASRRPSSHGAELIVWCAGWQYDNTEDA